MESTPLEQLNKLQEEGLYVFHGTGLLVETFEPRQGHTMINNIKTPDGEPAVFASPFVDYAIFMALINPQTCPKSYRSGCLYRDEKLHFRATPATLEQITPETTGYVHVFNRDDFKPRNPSEWISTVPVTPITVIAVTRSDFTPDIEEIPA